MRPASRERHASELSGTGRDTERVEALNEKIGANEYKKVKGKQQGRTQLTESRLLFFAFYRYTDGGENFTEKQGDQATESSKESNVKQ